MLQVSEDAGALLVEIGPDGVALCPDARRCAGAAALVGARLDALATPPERVVLCFETFWEARAGLEAAAARRLPVQPWQFTSEWSDWKELRRRCEGLKRLARKPVLITSPGARSVFSAEDLAAFGDVLEVDLAGDLPDAEGAAPNSDTLIYMETGGTLAQPKPIALTLEDLRARAASAGCVGGVHLMLSAFDTAEGIERFGGGAERLVLLNGGIAAEEPLRILETAEAQGVTHLHLTPGYVARLLHFLEGMPFGGALSGLGALTVTGSKILLEDVVALGQLLKAAGADALRVEFAYRTTEAGLISSTGLIPLEDLAATVRRGMHVAVGHGLGETEIRIVDREFTRLDDNEIGHVQVRRGEGVARHNVEADGTLTGLGHTTGWIDTNDIGFLDEGELTLTTRRNARLFVPARVTELSDIEARLSRIRGIRPGMVAALSLVRPPAKTPSLVIVFSALENTSAEVRRLASEIFSVVLAASGLQAEVFHCRERMFTLNSNLTIRRVHLARLVRAGKLIASAQPSMAFDGVETLSLAELQAKVALLWQTALELEETPGRDDDFFALGGDSLNLATMLGETEALFRQSVDLEAFFQVPTVAGLCNCLQKSAGARASVDVALPESAGHMRKMADFMQLWRGEKPFADSMLRGMNLEGSKAPLFWVLQSESSFLKLAEELGPDQPIYAMRSAVGVIEHYSHDALEEIANRYLWEVMAMARGRRFYLGGNCQGAIVALALAKRLRQIGLEPARLVMMEWFFDFGGYGGPTTFLTGEDSFVAELQQTVPSLAQLNETFPASDALSIAGAHGQFFRDQYIGGVVEGIRSALSKEG